MEKDIKKKLVRNWFEVLQDVICFDIEELEQKSKKFESTEWKKNNKKDEGGGEYRILENGKIFDKVGVNFSEVYGKFSKEFRACSNNVLLLTIWKGFGVLDLSLLLSPAANSIRNKLIF